MSGTNLARRSTSSLTTGPKDARGKIVYARTYSRPKPDGSFEVWEETIDRVISHQRWLWGRAQHNELADAQHQELEELRELLLYCRAGVAGRTMWLGGTALSKKKEATQFNCSFLRVTTIHDVVDAYWLLLQGCGVGFEPIVGTLSGFAHPMDVEIIRSEKTDPSGKGRENNVETFAIEDGHNIWRISVGDSAEAWAKLPGKLLANKRPCDKLVLSFEEIRPAGVRLTNYGWISSGDDLIATAALQLVKILNKRADRLLSRIDIMDVMNLLGATLSSRRSAEICLIPYLDLEWEEYASAKSDLGSTPWRTQSNNSLVFYQKPSKEEVKRLLDMMVESGGSEPGLVNGVAALRRAPWFKGLNPCGEILLGDKSFCNLVTQNLSSFNGLPISVTERATWLIARANYRQTCVNLDDGILQRTWHELNQFLRLCGVSLTGMEQWEFRRDPLRKEALNRAAWSGAVSMADELGLTRPKAVTTQKPEGTQSKMFGAFEGNHTPLGKYIFNNIRFNKEDEMLAELRGAGYRIFDDPYALDASLVTVPVEYEGDIFNGPKHTVVESAISQLNRYKHMMDHYVDHNASVTISYDPSEIPDIADWLLANWDSFVGVSFLLRNDPTKSAKDLGYAYLPQEVVTKEEFDAYSSRLKPIKLTPTWAGHDTMMDAKAECAGGQCPIR